MNQPPNIKPCPHCGASAESLDKKAGKGVYTFMNAFDTSLPPRLHVACLECGSSSPSVKTWNKRTEKLKFE